MRLLRLLSIFVDQFTPNKNQKSKYVKTKRSRSEVFYKKVVLKNFVNFTGKHVCQSFFFNKVVGPRPATLLKRDSGTGIFL